MMIYAKNLSNSDSLHQALQLIDSAIFVNNGILDKKNYGFYLNKYVVQRRLRKYVSALQTCDSMMLIHNNDFNANLYKGYIYEDMEIMDSSMFYYYKSRKLIDNPESFRAAEMVKDRQKLILTGLLNDTLLYNKLFTDFINKYDTSRFIQYYENEFQKFNRKQYLSNY
jgi:hypothetical protein